MGSIFGDKNLFILCCDKKGDLNGSNLVNRAFKSQHNKGWRIEYPGKKKLP